MFRSIPRLCPLDASSMYPAPNCDNQQCLQTLPNVPEGAKWPLLENHWPKRHWKIKTNIVLAKKEMIQFISTYIIRQHFDLQIYKYEYLTNVAPEARNIKQQEENELIILSTIFSVFVVSVFVVFCVNLICFLQIILWFLSMVIISNPSPLWSATQHNVHWEENILHVSEHFPWSVLALQSIFNRCHCTGAPKRRFSNKIRRKHHQCVLVGQLQITPDSQCDQAA